MCGDLRRSLCPGASLTEKASQSQDEIKQPASGTEDIITGSGGPDIRITAPSQYSQNTLVSVDDGTPPYDSPVVEVKLIDIPPVPEPKLPILLPDPVDDGLFEKRFRNHFNYRDFSDRLNLPLWSPGNVALGDVGFMRKGKFVHLDNAIGCNVIAGPRVLPGMVTEYNVIPVTETAVYPKLVSDKAKDFKVRIVSAFKPRRKTITKIIRKQSIVPLKPGQKAAKLIIEDGKIHMIRNYSKLKTYLIENIDDILKDAAEEGYGEVQKTDIVMVVGVLTASNYAMVVSDYAPGTTFIFNIISPARKSSGEPWGFWTFAQDPIQNADPLPSIQLAPSISSSNSSASPSPPPSLGSIPPLPPGLPVIDRRLPGLDDQPLQYSYKTSEPNGGRHAVHLSVLRFSPEGDLRPSRDVD
ncbi:uncharacterized protein IL334_007779 [Kwoniella shivajii]|uniref:Uncharacterized protein n=1 Tax=Kwoniella shivajii TaxID=564305 RepID=A0ABZ1D9K7_9TREE|nr:hypothetical protein IL334_007779 [Kwoniella shivajii]